MSVNIINIVNKIITKKGGDVPAKPKKISKKTIAFGIAGAVGAGAAEFVSAGFVSHQDGRTFFQNIASIAEWAAFIGLGISIGLLVVQSVYLKKKPAFKSLIKTVIIGIGLGVLAGAIAQAAFAFTSKISVMVEAISRAVCWGILGLGIGWGVSMFVPNYPKRRAILAGFLGGFIGGAIFRATFLIPAIPGGAGRFIGVAILGLFIGLMISLVEEALREAWLTVMWSRNETRSVSLGKKPIIFGSSPQADIYLPKDREPPVRATVHIESSQVVMHDQKTNQRKVLRNGDRVDFGKVSFVVNTKEK
jgi:Ca-activated chloride channel family protein